MNISSRVSEFTAEDAQAVLEGRLLGIITPSSPWQMVLWTVSPFSRAPCRDKR